MEPVDTPRKNAANVDERCDQPTTRSTSAANTNDGPKIPTVATTAPANPLRCQPMKVAVVKTGPGVNCPTETASSSTRG